MANYRIYTGGQRGEALGDSLPMMQNSTESDLTFEVFYEDGTAYTFAAGASIAGNFLDLGDEASDPPDVYVVSGTLTPTIGGNTFTWARVAADVGQVGRYNLSFELIAADAGVDWTFPIRYDIEEVPNGTLVPAVGLVGVTPEERAWLTAMLAANPTAWEFIPGTYDTATDTYQLKTTTDGQTLNLGREVFLLMRNDNGIAATQLNPKVFVSLGTIAGDEQFKSAIPALGSDIDNTSVWGINTTQADEGGKFKATSYGQVNAVNTSAWELNDDLYVSVDVRGDMTNVKPTINAHAVARVDKVGATDGILSVNTIANTRADTVTGALVSASYWMTAQTITPVATTFYEELLADQGSVASASEAVLVADNDKQPLAQDHLLEAEIANTALVAGEYSATLEMTLSVAASNQKVYIERYLTDGNGVVIDSGILTEPVGDLGVRPIFVFTSSLLAMETGVVTYVTLTGGLADNFAISTGQRLRDHIMCEKVGVLGPSVTFTVFFGSDHLSRTFGLAAVTTDNVVNAASDSGTQASATDALNNRVKKTSDDMSGTLSINVPTATDEALVLTSTDNDSTTALMTLSNTDAAATFFDVTMLQTQTNFYPVLFNVSRALGRLTLLKHTDPINLSTARVDYVDGGLVIYDGNTLSITLGSDGRAGIGDNPPAGTALYVTGGGSGGTIRTSGGNTAVPQMVIELPAGQSANSVEIQSSTGAALTSFSFNGAWNPPTLADSVAPNNSVYYSSTAGKLVYKDSGGVVNNLY